MDVESGAGYAVSEILDAKPDKFVLQDLPAAIEHAKQEGTLLEDVVKIEHSFFTEQPLKGLCVS